MGRLIICQQGETQLIVRASIFQGVFLFHLHLFPSTSTVIILFLAASLFDIIFFISSQLRRYPYQYQHPNIMDINLSTKPLSHYSFIHGSPQSAGIGIEGAELVKDEFNWSLCH